MGIIGSYMTGVRKGRLDVRLADQFFQAHGNAPEYEVAERFFTTLDEWVDRGDSFEMRGYQLTIRRYLRRKGPELVQASMEKLVARKIALKIAEALRTADEGSDGLA